jgi:hypothetical protein
MFPVSNYHLLLTLKSIIMETLKTILTLFFALNVVLFYGLLLTIIIKPKK